MKTMLTPHKCVWIGEGGCDRGMHQQSPPSLVTIDPGGLLALSIIQQRHTVSSRSPDLTLAPAATVLKKLGSIPSRLEQSTMAGSTVLHLGFLLMLAGILLLPCSSAQRVRGKFTTTVPHIHSVMPYSTGHSCLFVITVFFYDTPVCDSKRHAFLQ